MFTSRCRHCRRASSVCPPCPVGRQTDVTKIIQVESCSLTESSPPKQRGFWWAHIGWILCDRYDATPFEAIKDFSKYPELRWLNWYSALPGVLLGIGCLLAVGWQGLVWGFFISTVLLYHGTFLVNSLCHMVGTVRYKTTDTSRNSVLLALITMGEGWHNNHHHYSTSARMGFFWWEVDISYYALSWLSLFGIVWDMKKPSQRVLETARI